MSSTKLDKAANVFTILGSVVICVFVALQWSRSEARQSPPGMLEVGAVLEDDRQINYRSADRTVVVSLSSTCQFCTASVPALKRIQDLVNAGAWGRTQLMAVGLEGKEVISAYLQQHGLGEFTAVKAPANSNLAVLANRTPVLAVVDPNGAVVAVMAGQLAVEDVDTIKKKLDGV